MSTESVESNAVEQRASEKIPVDMDEAAATANPEASVAVAFAAGVVVAAATSCAAPADLDAVELPAPRDTPESNQPSASDLIDQRESATA